MNEVKKRKAEKRRLIKKQKQIAIQYVANDRIIKRATELSKEQPILKKEFHDLKSQIEGIESQGDEDPHLRGLTELCLA